MNGICVHGTCPYYCILYNVSSKIDREHLSPRRWSLVPIDELELRFSYTSPCTQTGLRGDSQHSASQSEITSDKPREDFEM